ncbi:MAG: CRISPR-associated helicase Cas3' [Planctomycetes bacterium]|nr:CRISPR-associated helicase Cas3' [Planctomycetota bacterium]
MQPETYYAHTLEGDPDPAHWQTLQSHLTAVAEKAAEFGQAFCADDWAYIAGLWHDIGKYRPEFQQRLRDGQTAVEHSGLGGALAMRRNKELGVLLAFAIAGHHTGLANPTSSDTRPPTPLLERIKSNNLLLDPILSLLPPEIYNCDVPSLPDFLRLAETGASTKKMLRHTELWIRFLFSALIDADRLDAEAFNHPERAALRESGPPMAILREQLDGCIEQKVAGLSSDERSHPVNQARADVLAACRQAATEAPGCFSLTVPTGGGKTLSAMSFALRHAEANDLRRVIVVIPYTSIIEQNAGVYRDALGPKNVVEHHSNFDPLKQSNEQGEEVTERHQLACENWDAPVIVTTSVQFFESLFSNRTSQCRKLHNICRSVIILDEVQTVPPAYLLSILDVLNELVSNYGCSVVLSTATPPALSERQRFEEGLHDVRPIISNPGDLATRLKRVEYDWCDPDAPAAEWEDLAAELAAHRQVLTVVHRRDDARSLAKAVDERVEDGSVLHLSALMCPAHRTDVLGRINSMLIANEPCRVVSTQLVEAGVDIDFPVVYRALAGLASIVQAAGRCNREGRLKQGQVVVFRAPTAPPAGTLRTAMTVTESLLREKGKALNPDDVDLFEEYFRAFYFTQAKDARDIQPEREQLNFANVAKKFKMIEDHFSRPVVVPYDGAKEILDKLRRDGPNRDLFRALQRYQVSIHENAFAKLDQAGGLEQVVEGLWTLTPGFERNYDERFGLVVGDEPTADPVALVK